MCLLRNVGRFICILTHDLLYTKTKANKTWLGAHFLYDIVKDNVLVLKVPCFMYSGFCFEAAPAAKVRSSCTDNYIWWADGSVDCKFLEEESLWGMHKNPNYWCNHYVLTDCCATCNRLRDVSFVVVVMDIRFYFPSINIKLFGLVCI